VERAHGDSDLAQHWPEGDGMVMRVVYVAGVGFSGSTLLSFLVNAHPQMLSVGELTGPIAASDGYACSCGARVRDCAFFARVGEALRARGIAFDALDWRTAVDFGASAPARFLLTRSLRNNRLDDLRDALVARTPGLGAQMAGLLARNRAFAAALCEVAARPVLVDASKQPIRAHYLARAGLDVRWVHLVRDAPGFVASRCKNLGVAIDEAIAHWRRGATSALRVAARFAPDRKRLLRYEDVCDDPRGAVNAIATLADLPPLAADAPVSVPGAHVIGNRMRLGFDGQIARDERWRTLLSRDELARVLARTNRLRARFGYCES
jgi:hypothetical protein